MTTSQSTRGELPELALDDWEQTKETLHLWAQIVGKVRLASTAPRNHWWHVTLYVDVRGLTTRPMRSSGGVTFQIDFDFIDHRLVVRTDRGEASSFALEDGLSVAALDESLHSALLRDRRRPSTLEREMLGRRERHRRRARGGGWLLDIAIEPWAVVPAFFSAGVLRQSAGPLPLHFANRAWQVENLVEFAKRRPQRLLCLGDQQPATPPISWALASCSAQAGPPRSVDGGEVPIQLKRRVPDGSRRKTQRVVVVTLWELVLGRPLPMGLVLLSVLVVLSDNSFIPRTSRMRSPEAPDDAR